MRGDTALLANPIQNLKEVILSIHWMGYLWAFIGIFLALVVYHQITGERGGV